MVSAPSQGGQCLRVMDVSSFSYYLLGRYSPKSSAKHHIYPQNRDQRFGFLRRFYCGHAGFLWNSLPRSDLACRVGVRRDESMRSVIGSQVRPFVSQVSLSHTPCLLRWHTGSRRQNLFLATLSLTFGCGPTQVLVLSHHAISGQHAALQVCHRLCGPLCHVEMLLTFLVSSSVPIAHEQVTTPIVFLRMCCVMLGPDPVSISSEHMTVLRDDDDEDEDEGEAHCPPMLLLVCVRF